MHGDDYKYCDKLKNADLIQSLTPPCADGLGGVEPPVVPLGIKASPKTPLIIPNAVKTLTIAKP